MLSRLETDFVLGVDGLVRAHGVEAAVGFGTVLPLDALILGIRSTIELVEQLRDILAGLLDAVGVAPADEVEPAADRKSVV